MARKVLVLDAGNGIIKAKNSSNEVEFPHALKELSATEFQQVVDRNHGKAPADYIKVNGRGYVVGESAERHGVVSRLTGAARYHQGYYGVFAAMSMARAYTQGTRLTMFCGHPPIDHIYRESLGASVLGVWDILYKGQSLQYEVTGVDTWEEPEGGLFNAMLTNDGKHYQEKSLQEGTTLVIDIGAFTTDLLGMLPGGEINESVRTSVPYGILHVLGHIEKTFRATYPNEIQGAMQIPADRLRESLKTGCIRGGGLEYDISEIVQEAVYMVTNQIVKSYFEIGGGSFNWDNVLMSGGGSGGLHEYVIPELKHNNVLFAGELPRIHRANLDGAMKLFKMLEASGVY